MAAQYWYLHMKIKSMQVDSDPSMGKLLAECFGGKFP